MIKVTGLYKEYDEKPVLMIELSENELFEKIVTHVNLNMFFSYKRSAAKFKNLILCSVGDCLDKNNNQDFNKAEVALFINIKQDISKDLFTKLESGHTWFICIRHKNDIYMFAIDKETEYIKDRRYYKNVG